ncbi:hypothetical protein Z043_123475 [Scleropages formosus]|uniref:Zinc finger CCHC domain-containing protein n=1 Tax=Scleropages formosus TaxID=113540 RepID=A0A0P7UHK3_SCLFO|nr:hypothetical protein Z043_123475 [Scleropages formosus]
MDRRIITIHVFNPFVPPEAIHVFLQRHVDLLPGHRDIQDEFGIWNRRRQFQVRLRPNPVAPDGLHHHLGYFNIQNKAYLFYPKQPPFCRLCQGQGHRKFGLQALTLMDNKVNVVEMAVEMAVGAREALGEASLAPTLLEILKWKKEHSTPKKKKKKKSRREAVASEGALYHRAPFGRRPRASLLPGGDRCRVGPAQFPVDVSESVVVVRGRTGDTKLGGVPARWGL